jgi:2-C-methyl-D-erythritol 4-phosphate cytidylyltransferase/2-C-methyl-D-erythritol 2,4-cyclodiphosphate synthase
MQTAVIIVAAGRGSRMGGEVPKQWQMLAGKPVLAHTLAAFRDAGAAGDPPRRPGAGRGLGFRWWKAGRHAMPRSWRGCGRWKAPGSRRVLIHDGARPLVSRAV